MCTGLHRLHPLKLLFSNCCSPPCLQARADLDQRLVGHIEYDTELFGRPTVVALARRLEALLTRVREEGRGRLGKQQNGRNSSAMMLRQAAHPGAVQRGSAIQ